MSKKRNTTPTILAARRKQLKIKIVDTRDSIALQVNSIFKTKINTGKSPLQLLREMPALKIINNAFYAEARVRLKVDSAIEVVKISELLENQSGFLKDLIEENKHIAKDIALQKMKRKFDRNEKSNEE